MGRPLQVDSCSLCRGSSRLPLQEGSLPGLESSVYDRFPLRDDGRPLYCLTLGAGRVRSAAMSSSGEDVARSGEGVHCPPVIPRVSLWCRVMPKSPSFNCCVCGRRR